MPLLLTRSEVERLLDHASLVAPLTAGFMAYSAVPAPRALRTRSDLPGAQGTATVLYPGTVEGIPAYTVKVHAKFPGQTPAIRGVLCLHDLATGSLLAIMDSTYLTAVRTGVAAALATNLLARTGAEVLAVIGAGEQARHVVRALSGLRPISQLRAFDHEPERGRQFASFAAELGIETNANASLAGALDGADIVVTATWAREPFLDGALVRPGMHITTLGSDEPGKREVSLDVVRDALFVCDDRDLALTMGAAQGGDASYVDAELGEVLSERHPGRTSEEQVTVYGGVGLAFQDLVAAWSVYEATRTGSIGREIDFLA